MHNQTSHHLVILSKLSKHKNAYHIKHVHSFFSHGRCNVNILVVLPFGHDNDNRFIRKMKKSHWWPIDVWLGMTEVKVYIAYYKIKKFENMYQHLVTPQVNISIYIEFQNLWFHRTRKNELCSPNPIPLIGNS